VTIVSFPVATVSSNGPVDDAIGDGVIEKDGVAEGVDRES
jgi:hypothetical protein